MATVSEDLIKEGSELLIAKNAEEIHKFADRIISVEPENWYGLYARGCGYALEADFGNCISNWEKFLSKLDDDCMVEKLCTQMCEMLTHCLTHVSGKPDLNFGNLGEMLNIINDKLPECEDEIFVTKCLALGQEYCKDNAPVEPMLTYYSYKALVFCSFRAYVEFHILTGFFDSLIVIGEEIKAHSNPKIGDVIDTDNVFLNEVKSSMDSALEKCSPETLEKIEEYWLSHKVDTYVSHLQQAYNASAAVATAGKLTGKIAKKLMHTETELFIKTYFGAKI